MAGAHYRIDQAANTVPTGTSDIARVDIWQSQLMHFLGDSTDGQTSPVWTVLAWPFGSARQQFTAPTTFDATYTPDVPGSYRVEFVVDNGIAENRNVFIFGVTRNSTGLVIDNGIREPAYGEATGEDTSASNDRGYARAYELAMPAEIPTIDTKTVLRTRMAYKHTQVHLLGLVTKGDGLGGVFYWDAASTTADDDTNVFQPTGLATGRWKRTVIAAAVSGLPAFSGARRTLVTVNGSTAVWQEMPGLGSMALGDYPAGGSIGSAATTVDIHQSFVVTQTTPGQTLILPSPTDFLYGGRIAIISASPTSEDFYVAGTSVPQGFGAIFRWDTEGWALCGQGASPSNTLVGDATGAIGANIVEAISGAAGTASVKCNNVTFIKTVTPTITQAPPTTANLPGTTMEVIAQAAQVSGNGPGGDLVLGGGRHGAAADAGALDGGQVTIAADGGDVQVCHFGREAFTAGSVLSDGSGNLYIDAAPGALYNEQKFTTPGAFTCTLPTGAYKRVRVRLWAAGAGGASGSKNTGGADGGSGGAGGAYIEHVFDFADLGGNGATIAGSVGAGGAGGATSTSTPNAGAAGGASWFGPWLSAYGGGPGGVAGGSSAPGTGGGVIEAGIAGTGANLRGGGTPDYTVPANGKGVGYEGASTGTLLVDGLPAIYGGGSGGSPGVTSATARAGGNSVFGGAGGGAGGGGDGSVARAGGAGGFAGARSDGSFSGNGGAGGAVDNVGAAGAAVAGRGGCGGGGGGGTGGVGFAGGAGGARGGGGGGGGFAQWTGPSGAGGAGGRGEVQVICE